jgi:nicotinate-nucleotide pyrophosphorylase (carboxylating)
VTAAFASLDPASYRDLVKRALAEDLGSGDISTNALVGQNDQAIGIFIVKSPCTVAGLAVAVEAFSQLDPAARATWRFHDGDECSRDAVLGQVEGRARALLSATEFSAASDRHRHAGAEICAGGRRCDHDSRYA